MTPVEALAEVDGKATVFRTPCGEGGSMAWRIWGDRTDRTRMPVVLLHGAFGTWAHFARNILPLAERYTVIAPDMPNHGESDMLPEGSLAPDFGVALASGLTALFPDAPGFRIVGFSLGGILGAWTSVSLGGKAKGFVICSTGAIDGPYRKVAGLRKWRHGMAQAEMEAIHRHNLGILMFAEPARVDDLAVHIQRTNALCTRVRGPDIVPPGSILQALARIDAPVDGIWGGDDVYAKGLLPEREALIRRVLPGFAMHVIPSAGHWVMYEQAHAFNALLPQILDARTA
ncbi:MAG: alpha/beta fold hydrolase [Alphaproteobacteria bacterium]